MMIRSCQFFLIFALLTNGVRLEVLPASNVQICTDLCAACGGTSIFNNEICDCRIADNDEKAAECIKHTIKRQNVNFDLAAISDQEDTNREARCSLLKSKKRMRSGDIDRVVNYFVNSGPMADVPRLGAAKPSCDSSGEIVRTDNDFKPAKKKTLQSINQVTSPRKSEGVVPTKKDDVPVTTTPKALIQSDIVAAPRLLQSRSLHHHKRLLNAIPNVLLEIPQAIASALVPKHGRVHYAPYSGVPRNGYFLGTPQHQYMLGSVATGTSGVLGNNDDVLPAYVPAIDHSGMVPHIQPANPHVGIPNALLAGVETPSYFPGLYRATHYAPVLSAIVPQSIDDISNNANVDSTPTIKHKSVETDASRLPQLKVKEKPTALHSAIAQQNSILESLSQQLRNYGPSVAMPRYQYSQMPYGIVGAPNPMQQCYCNDQGSAVVGAQRSLLNRRKPSIVKEMTPQPKTAEVTEPATIPPTQELSEEYIDEESPVNTARSSRQLPPKKEECDWQCVTRYLDTLNKDGYPMYRAKRGNAEDTEKSDETVLHSEAL